MSETAAVAAAVAERWVTRAIDAYPAAVRATLTRAADPFRNPAGYALKENLSTLAREVCGAMDSRVIEPAIDALMRLRAVQDFTPSDALRFISDLRTSIAEVSGSVTPSLDSRIDELARMASEKYTECRKQIDGLRLKELHVRAKYEAT